MSEKMATETVYVTTTNSNEDSHVMSEKVQSLAGSIYKEFEKVIKKYDEDVVKDLMPLVVGILEALDASFVEKQELDVELELVREDNEQLLTQYEREKQLRKAAEQKFLEMEDNMEGTKKELEDKVEILESIIRMSEIKSKNTSDLVTRLEEKEQESKGEYNKLHERYTELFRTHMDYMERTKVLLGTDKVPELTLPSHKVTKGGFNLHPISVTYGNTIELHKHEGSSIGFEASTPHQAGSNVNLRAELNAQLANRSYLTSEKEQLTDSINVTESATATRLNQTLAEIIASTPELTECHESIRSHGSLENLSSVHNDRSMYEEIQATDIAEVDFGVGISERRVNRGESATDSDKEDEEEDEESKDNDRDSVGDNFYGMCRELENLILENTELLATKNALNIVKDDLITKIDVLTSEQEVLREEIVILNSVRRKLQERISHLEEELKKLKEEIGKKEKEEAEKEEEEDDIPMAQRKRFTRVEMARVLMERNQYKERLMELQEAVRWTEIMRASKEHPGELQTKKKSGAWNFFSELVSPSPAVPESPVPAHKQMPKRHQNVLQAVLNPSFRQAHFGNLFSSSNKPKPNVPIAATKYNNSVTSSQPGTDADKKPKGTIPKSNSYDFLQDDLTSEKVRKEREKERREQYKQVRALVTKDDGRLQAYGWSLPAKLTSSVKDSSDRFQVPVPVPVYCRPLFDFQTGWKIWCASGVNLTGDHARDGETLVGDTMHRQNPSPKAGSSSKELKGGKATMNDTDIEEMSSLVWICTADHDSSQVSVISANNPADILETFFISVSHILCIASVPGALDGDYPYEEILTAETPTGLQRSTVISGSSPGREGESIDLGGVSLVQSTVEETDPLLRPAQSPGDSEFDALGKVGCDDDINVQENEGGDAVSDGELDEGDPLRLTGSDDMSHLRVFRAEGFPATPTCTTPTPTSAPGGRDSATDFLVDGRFTPSAASDEAERMSSVLPTMWMGTHNGSVYVHSSVSGWKRCLHSVKLKDSVLGIVHVKGRVLVSLANGTVAVFHRAPDGQWDLLNYHLIDLGQPKQCIRCMTVVDGKHVWCGYKNKIHIVCPQSMAIQKSFDAHPRKESQVRQLCWVGDGVWVSIRLDSTLRLYHAYTHQHLQDVDVEPYVSKMLGTGKLGFSFVRITAMLISCNRLWIGTSNGVIISVPLSESDKQPMIATSASLDGPSGSRPGGVVRVYSDASMDSTSPSTFIPYCSMAQAQLSFHGHKDAVKFFVSVPDVHRPATHANPDTSTLTSALSEKGEATPAPQSKARLILSGGEGYVDFRIGDVDEGEQGATTSVTGEEDNDDPSKATSTSKVDNSHVIVWQVTIQD